MDENQRPTIPPINPLQQLAEKQEQIRQTAAAKQKRLLHFAIAAVCGFVVYIWGIPHLFDVSDLLICLRNAYLDNVDHVVSDWSIVRCFIEALYYFIVPLLVGVYFLSKAIKPSRKS
ncbi:MAG: hypothetical protein LBB67_04895 [Oscillospiraceae bacterium]|jgi:hypothetical protein|nr:hypothetical protein [Oscillospiraceae bacterium]